MAHDKKIQMREGLATLAEPTEHNESGADKNPRVARWVDTQVEEYLETRRTPGLLCYEDCAAEELLVMAEARGHKIHEIRPVKMIGLVNWLRKADSEATIKFTDMRDDARKLVYEWHFASLDANGIPAVHQQSAITRANRQLRAEALPVFSNACAFQLHFTSSRVYKDHVRYPRPPVKLSVDSGKFLRSVPSDWLRFITRVDLNLVAERGITPQLNLLFRLRNNLDTAEMD